MSTESNSRAEMISLLKEADLLMFGTIDLPYALANHPWKQADAAWFKMHKHRQFRLRPVMAEEFSSRHEAISNTPPPTHVLTRKTGPNVREKTFVTLINAKKFADCDDALLMVMWDGLMNGVKGPINLAIFVKAQAEFMARGAQ